MKTARPSSTYRAARRAAFKAGKVSRADWSRYCITDSARRDNPGFPRPEARPAPIDHPGANPLHSRHGRARQTIEVPNPGTGLLTKIKLYGPRNPNKYVPHIGAKQRAKGARAVRL